MSSDVQTPEFVIFTDRLEIHKYKDKIQCRNFREKLGLGSWKINYILSSIEDVKVNSSKVKYENYEDTRFKKFFQ